MGSWGPLHVGSAQVHIVRRRNLQGCGELVTISRIDRNHEGGVQVWVRRANGEEKPVRKQHLRPPDWSPLGPVGNDETSMALAERGIYTGRNNQNEIERRATDFAAYCGSEAILEFAHPAELEFAKHLDSAGLRWKREPKLFGFDGGQGFQPDFYLPDVRMYVEVTTIIGEHDIMGQRRGKDTKQRNLARMMQEYPGIDVVCLFAEQMLEALALDPADLLAYLRTFKKLQRKSTRAKLSEIVS